MRVLFAMNDAEHTAQALRAEKLWPCIQRGREGWEWWRMFGAMRHVYAYRLHMGGVLRIIGPETPPTNFSVRNERRVMP